MTTATDTHTAPRFGWCATGHHRTCRRTITSSQTRTQHRCGCTCHRRQP